MQAVRRRYLQLHAISHLVTAPRVMMSGHSGKKPVAVGTVARSVESAPLCLQAAREWLGLFPAKYHALVGFTLLVCVV